MSKIIQVNPGQFSKDGLRAGDLIALCNFLEYIREKFNDPKLSWYFLENTIRNDPHVLVMWDWILKHTDYFHSRYPYLLHTDERLINIRVAPGTDETYPDLINIWNIREKVISPKQHILRIPDAVKFPNQKSIIPGKVVIVPVMDAPYNVDRNWSLQFLQQRLDIGDNKFYSQGIIACKEPIEGLQLSPTYRYCHDYKETLNHIQEAHTYIGGDTGLSHFAGALNANNIKYYFYPKSTYGTTNPFHWIASDMTYTYLN